MRSNRVVVFGGVLTFVVAGTGVMVGSAAQTPQAAQAAPGQGAQRAQVRVPPPDPTIAGLVARLSLEQYKGTVKGLTQFGDRQAGTKRNRDAVDWIEAQLKSYGCTNTERITYTYTTA